MPNPTQAPNTGVPLALQKFKHNDHEIRFFEAKQQVYFVTIDCERAFGFKGNDSILRRQSFRLDSMELSINYGDLPRDTSVIFIEYLIRSIVRSSDSTLGSIADIFIQMAAKGFMAPLTQPPERLALPAATDHERVENMASASRRHDPDKLPQNLELMDGWETVTGMLLQVGENPKDDDSLLRDTAFRFWINRQLADIYRAQKGEEPPIVSRKRTKGYCYPPSFLGLVRLYRSNWLAENS